MPEFRREGSLKPLKTARMPKRLVFWDTETTSPNRRLKSGNFDLILGVMICVELSATLEVLKREVCTFYSTEDFLGILDIFIPKRSTAVLFAHNTGFDIRVLNLPSILNDNDYISKPPIINERAFIWKVKNARHSMTFLDTANLGVTSVGQLGYDLHFPKLEIDFKTCSKEELAIYCLRDVEVIERFVLDYLAYLQTNELGGFRNTLAGQAMAAYRTRFMSSPPYIHVNEDALKLERDGYHGGRVECFRMDKQPKQQYYYLDVNSMYPASMIGDKLPVKLVGYGENVRLSYLPIRMKHYYCIAECDIETDEPVYAVLRNHKLVFPIGKFTTVLYSPELAYAYEHNHIRAIKRCAVYEYGCLFDDYVQFFYSAKQKYTEEGNSSYRYISKLFLNSLYGKFGQLRPIREFIAPTDYKGVWRLPIIDIERGLHYQEIAWYGEIYKEYKEGETSISSPAIAGAITAQGRMHLWNYIRLADRENIYYVDTDSLITNRKGYKRLLPFIHPSELGLLKLEKTSISLTINGNKDYKFGRITKTKGIPSKARKISKNKWEYLQFQGFISWLNEGASGSPKGWYTTKERKGIYNKGKVQADNTILPFNFPSDL